MMLNRVFMSILAVVFCTQVIAQSDTVLTIEEFTQIVQQHHPMAYRANQMPDMGKRGVQEARGAFDPRLAGDIEQKYYNGKQYFSYLNGELKIPTWFGIEVFTGYEQNQGVFLNPESIIPEGGYAKVGASINLGRGLIIDQRRAALWQAKINQTNTELEQQILLNQLLFDAKQAYWNWWAAEQKYKVVQNGLEQALFRFESVKTSAALGDNPWIDTVKAHIQVQERQMKLAESDLARINKRTEMELYLWFEGETPLELDTNTIPGFIDSTSYSPTDASWLAQMDTLIETHPEFQLASNYIDQQEVSYRISKENLKPELKLSYSALSGGFQDFENPEFNTSNYIWSAQVSYPLFIRKERAKLNLNRLKLNELKFEQRTKKAEIELKISKAANEWNTTFGLVNNIELAVNNYKRLLDSEVILFNRGESSLFLVNQREINYIESQLKQVDVQLDNLVAKEKFLLVSMQGYVR